MTKDDEEESAVAEAHARFLQLVDDAAVASIAAHVEDLEAMDAFMSARARCVKSASSGAATPREGTPRVSQATTVVPPGAPTPAPAPPIVPSKHEREAFGGPTHETAAKLWRREG